MSRPSPSRRSLILVTLGVVLGMVLGVTFAERLLYAFVPPYRVPGSTASEFRLMAEAWQTVTRYYVDHTVLKPRRLAYGAISGLVDSLGDTGHSTFLTPEMRKEAKGEMKGQFQGIGAELRMKNGRAVIVAPMDDSPAQRAGLRPGDVILKVDGADVLDLTLEQIVSRILGPAGTQVTLGILTPATGQIRDVRMTRAHITIHNVTWHPLPGTSVAHVRIAGFSKGVSDQLRAVLKEVTDRKLSVILDLRNNPGGLLDEAIAVASQFLQGGDVLLEKNAAGKITPIPVKKGGVALRVPMVALINQGTASAAEIVAGALQDAGRARLVGETTFGTGTVLREFPLSDGSALLLATQEWLTPKGRTIWHRGIEPDVTVSLALDASPLFPQGEEGMTAAQFQKAEDPQLKAALAALAGQAL